MSENLQKRIISAGILAPVVLMIVWAGGALFSTTVVVVAVIMSFEWYGIITANGKILSEQERKRWEFSGIAYVASFAGSLIYLRNMESGFGIIFLMLVIVWATDIAAFFAGRIIGGPKIYPKISPNKTWAGLGGGMIAAALVTAFSSVFVHSVGFFSMLLLGAVLAVVSQAGDFFESWVKRRFEVKDSGTIIPGHGGVLDRVDGLVTVVIVFAIIAMLNGGNFFQ